MKTCIQLKNVSKVYPSGDHDFRALDHVDLDIAGGELVVILGPSGAGKSTLLNLIGGMDTPTDGEIFFHQENITHYNEDQLSDYRAQNVGFIFQFYNILPSLTALENVEVVREVTNEAQDAMAALRSVGLEDHWRKFPSQLSGGEQQRVSIARAIAKNPTLLLCDEPTGALDSETGVGILRLLRQQCGKQGGNSTVIIVTHNTLFARIADTVIRVKNGTIEETYHNVNPMDIDDVNW